MSSIATGPASAAPPACLWPAPTTRNGENGAAGSRRYCIDADFLAALDRMSRAEQRRQALAIRGAALSYILTTGGNWRAPIGDFRLVVDKGAPRNLVSFCGEGVRRISPTQFEIRHRNWRPDRDLAVLIVCSRRRIAGFRDAACLG